nr:hypothetical protein [Tanacetum cinerariifolium]
MSKFAQFSERILSEHGPPHGFHAEIYASRTPSAEGTTTMDMSMTGLDMPTSTSTGSMAPSGASASTGMP